MPVMKCIVRSAILVAVIFSQASAQGDRIALHLEEGKSGAVWDLAWTSDGKRLWSCGRDSTVKAWNLENGEAVLSLRAPRATLVTSVALSPDDALVAAGDMNGHILVWETASGMLRHDIAAHRRYISDVAFTPDGRTIAACGRDDTLSLWDASTGRELRRIAAACVWVNALSVSHDGRLLATAGQDGSVKVWDLAGGSLVRVLGRHRRFARTVLFTPDDAVLLSGGRDGSVRAWDVRKGILLQEFPVNIGFPHHLALDPTGQLLAVSMMNGLLEIWDWGRQTRRASIPNSYGAMAAAFQPRRPERLASAHTDGAVRIWNAQDGTEIVDFVGFSDGQWLTFTPDGYYDCSAFGDRYVQWRKGEELYPLARYQALYKQPSVIEDALAGTYTPERRLERIADPPEARILSPRDGQLFAFGAEPLEVIVEARARDARKIESLGIHLNGRPVPERNLLEARTIERSDTSLVMHFRVAVLPGVNTVEAVAQNAARVRSRPASAVITVETRDRPQPNLFVLSVGIDRYGPDYPELTFAAHDARAIAERLAAQEGKQYTRVYSRVLIDGEATRANILGAIAGFPPMTPNDVLVLFFSGHGVRVRERKGGTEYAFVTAGVNRKTVAREGLLWSDFARTLADARAGRVILFLDACHSGSVSGGASNEKVAAALADKVGVIFASSSGSEYSFENRSWGHGAFTRSLLDALSGEADFTGNGIIDWSELQLYVTNRVRELTGGAQNPMIPRLDGFANFDVARVR